MQNKSLRHIIKRQVVELHGLREEDALQMQRLVANLVHDQFVPLLDRYLSALSPNGSVLRLEKLELDLGHIPFDQLESELLHQLNNQLSAQISGLKHSLDKPAPSKSTARLPATHRELIHFFVRTGNLPWWADAATVSATDSPVAESMEFLLNREQATLTADLRGWVAQESILLRLIRHLPDETLLRMGALCIHLPHIDFAGAASELLRRMPHIATFVGQPLYRVREQVLLKLLQIVFSTPAPVRDAAIFWEEWLLQVAVALRAKYKPLLQSLGETVGSDNTGLAAILSRLANGKSNRKTLTLPELLLLPAERLLHDLEQSIAPGQQPAALRIALRRWLSNQQSAVATAQMEEAMRQILVGIPSLGPTLIKKWTAVLARLLLDTSLPEDMRSTLATAKQRLETPDFPLPELPALLVQIARAESSRLPEAASDEPASTEFSESGEIFVENAGLVILWPYLTRFYKSLGLLEKGKFLDAAAAHRAAVLLQYLATGQPEVQEYHMALNKILCGLSWDVVLEPGLPLGETEIEECEGLLQAVIANAPVLRNMSPDGLRGSFLLRKGVLRPVAGTWELHVEKATHDVVLEKFPWTWNVVKLPWLEGILVVEW